MANSQGMASSFKSEILRGLHALGTSVIRAATTKDTIRAALYLSTATIGPATTAYTATGEVTGTGYTAGGVVVSNSTEPTTSGTTGIWTPSASIVYSGVTISGFDCVLLYNDTSSGNLAISAHTFASQSVTAGTFTLTMPTHNSTTALIRIA